jgi:hypothetical protein
MILFYIKHDVSYSVKHNDMLHTIAVMTGTGEQEVGDHIEVSTDNTEINMVTLEQTGLTYESFGKALQSLAEYYLSKQEKAASE